MCGVGGGGSELSSLMESIYVKTREASPLTDLDMGEFLGIDKALQNVHGELLNNTSKLTENNKLVKKKSKKLQEVKMILLILMNKGSCIKID